MSRIRIAHVSTVDLTLRFLLLGQLARLRDEGFDVTAISAPGPWVADLEGEGIRHVAWPHATRAWNPRADAVAFLELYRLFKRERFDLVHTHTPKPGVMGRVAARLAGIPCVVNTVHGLFATPQDPARKRIPVLAIERAAAAFSDLELFQSREDLVWARRIKLVSAGKSLLLGNGTDLSVFDPALVPAERKVEMRRELGVPDGAPVVGTVGRLVAEKGYRELFAAAAEIRRALPQVRFIAVGSSDPEKADNLTDLEISRANGDVIFTGWRKDVRDLLAIFDIFVLPSWREGFPRSAMEAAAMAKPLVLTDIRGCREVGRHGKEALLVPPRRADELARAIMTLVQDEDLRRRLGEAARVRALEAFDERRIADRVAQSYRFILARKGIAADGSMRSPHRSGQYEIRPAVPSDIEALASLHRRSLPDAFLTSLGEGFLRRIYRTLVNDPSAVVLVARDGPALVGFASAVPSVKAFYRRFYLRQGILAGVSAAPRMIRPTTLIRARQTARYPRVAAGLPDAELLAMAVAEGHRGGGVGRSMAVGVLDELSSRGVAEVKVVVASENEGANRFYERLGFQSLTEFNFHWSSNVLVFRCPSSSVLDSLSS